MLSKGANLVRPFVVLAALAMVALLILEQYQVLIYEICLPGKIKQCRERLFF